MSSDPYAQLKASQRQAWGLFAPLEAVTTIPAAELVKHARVRAHQMVLDAGCGRRFDTQLLAMLPAGIDPCGENGDFHTFISAGPMFPRAIQVVPGEVVVREGFAFADLLLEP